MNPKPEPLYRWVMPWPAAIPAIIAGLGLARVVNGGGGPGWWMSLATTAVAGLILLSYAAYFRNAIAATDAGMWKVRRTPYHSAMVLDGSRHRIEERDGVVLVINHDTGAEVSVGFGAVRSS